MRVMWMWEPAVILLGFLLHPVLHYPMIVRGDPATHSDDVPTTYLITRTHPVHSHTVIYPIRDGQTHGDIIDDGGGDEEAVVVRSSLPLVHAYAVSEAGAEEAAAADGNTSGGSDGTVRKGTSSSGHKSSHDSSEENSGDSVNEEHHVQTADSGEKDTETHESDHDEDAHEDGAHGGSGHRQLSAEKEARRSFEKGFHKQYRKKESHQLHKFFGNLHKGGEFHLYGKENAQHASANSGSGKGTHSQSGAVEKKERSKKQKLA